MNDQDQDQYDIFDKPAPSNGTTTSDAAAEAIAQSASTLRTMVLCAHFNAGDRGLTEHEGCLATGLDPNTFRPRRWELAKAAWLVESGTTRPSKPNGKRQAAVWIHKDFVPKAAS